MTFKDLDAQIIHTRQRDCLGAISCFRKPAEVAHRSGLNAAMSRPWAGADGQEARTNRAFTCVRTAGVWCPGCAGSDGAKYHLTLGDVAQMAVLGVYWSSGDKRHGVTG